MFCVLPFTVSVEMKEQEAELRELKENLTHLENLTQVLGLENKLLVENLTEVFVENKLLKNRTAQLSRERDDLNHTLEVILTFDLFPVKDFCLNKSEFCTMRTLTTEAYQVTTDDIQNYNL